MNKLDNLINDWIFDCMEPRAFSSNDEDNSFLIRYLQSDGVKVNIVRDEGYFYCTMKQGELEVCSDSRQNLRPRSVKEAVCVAALKIYIPSNDKTSWNKIIRALDLEELLEK